MEKYNIVLEYGLMRIIAEGPLQLEFDNSEHGGYCYYIFNMRVEDLHGNILSPILNKVSFSEISRSGADLDEAYSMEGFYLVNETFGFLNSRSWSSLTDPSSWSWSADYHVSSCNMEVRNIDTEDFKKGIEISINTINGISIEILNKYLNEIIYFEKNNKLPNQNTAIFRWDDILGVLNVSPLVK